jgi:hypothetical protein
MLKKYSGTRSEKACASIAENVMWLRVLNCYNGVRSRSDAPQKLT